MNDERRVRHLDSLNRAFEKAFAHAATQETLLDLLGCIGSELHCDRIAIFEIGPNRTCDNTCEWCAHGFQHMSELLQNVPLARFDSWIQKVREKEFLKMRDLETAREEDPDVYELLHSQAVHSAVAAQLAFHGKEIGFFIMENPGEEFFAEAASVMPGLRYILSSLVYSDHLVRKLQKMGFVDHLTGLGNRAGLHEKLGEIDRRSSLGLSYFEVVGWMKEDGAHTHVREEQAFIRTAEILSGIFDSDHVFNVAPGEFLAVAEGVDEGTFRSALQTLSRLFNEHELLVSEGSYFRDPCGADFNAMIREAHLKAHEQVKALTEQQAHALRDNEDDLFDETERADISLYRSDEFFRKASDFLNGFFDEQILVIVIDLNYFKLYNDIYGRKAGNLFLEAIAEEVVTEARKTGGIAGYLGGDNFCMIIPVKEHTEESLRPMIEGIVADLEYPDGFAPAFGIYLSEDRQESLVAMYDHALTALQEIKGSYIEHYRFYDADHFRRDRETKLLLMDVKKGLPEGEFLFYLQPQVIEATGKIVGAEALVRWKCRGQIISPSQFIPALEKSGYIYAVDSFVWESVVKWLKSLGDRGIRQVPISVNVSRVDFYFGDIAQQFIDLVRKYDVDPALIGVEITESAFTDNMDMIMDAVTRLHEAGFSVLMDDFGSGSSSLSMLHTMNLDVLKTDVRFMSQKDSDKRSISIVESVVSMAHMIGMIVITEGVETERQKEDLIALGDNYAQGFFFYRPMPVEEFELLLLDDEKIGSSLAHTAKAAETQLKFRELIREGMLSDTLLDNIIGAAAVLRREDGEMRLVQMNRRYEKLAELGGAGAEALTAYAASLIDNNRDEIERMIGIADNHPYDGAAGTLRLKARHGFRILESRLFPFYTCDSHTLYLTTLEE